MISDAAQVVGQSVTITVSPYAGGQAAAARVDASCKQWTSGSLDASPDVTLEGECRQAAPAT
jgi:hypothetical protein